MSKCDAFEPPGTVSPTGEWGPQHLNRPRGLRPCSCGTERGGRGAQGPATFYPFLNLVYPISTLLDAKSSEDSR